MKCQKIWKNTHNNFLKCLHIAFSVNKQSDTPKYLVYCHIRERKLEIVTLEPMNAFLLDKIIYCIMDTVFPLL